jgi:hypothetical protein
MTDLEIIKRIEKELKIKLEKVDIITWTNKGYTLNQNGSVTGLSFSECKIVNLDQITYLLEDLMDLSQLSVNNCQLNDISLLQELMSLTHLFLFHNQISDISPLEELTSLTQLSLANNQISDISPLKDIKSLTQLSLARNKISDISPLKELKSLTKLFLHNNQLIDISPLRDLKKLDELDLRNNLIENLPTWITDFNLKIQWALISAEGYITFYDKSFKNPPLEIIKQGKEAIQNYFDQPPEKINRDQVFVSYSHKDQEWLTRVQTHLKVLKNLGIEMNLWDDTQIKPGMNWKEEIRKALSAAKVAILLVSADFLASDFVSSDELPPLLKAAENDGATILPLILKPCLYKMHPKLGDIQAVNDPIKPLSKLAEYEQDEIFVTLVERVAELINEN